MTYQEANHISIKDYLKSLGILPAVDKYYYGMYHSPFRQESAQRRIGDEGNVSFVTNKCAVTAGESLLLLFLCDGMDGAVNRLQVGAWTM